MVVLVIPFIVPTMALRAQSTEELQAELKQMKQQYEQKLAALEGRIANLEEQNAAIVAATKQTTVSVSDLKAKDSASQTKEAPADKLTRDERTQIAQEEVANTPRYDLIRDADQRITALTEQVKLFEYHGYLRSGAGLNGDGGRMVAFQAPGAGAKYRLGNETDTYGEFSGPSPSREMTSKVTRFGNAHVA